MLGKRFTRLLITAETSRKYKRGSVKQFICLCDCGNTVSVSSSNLYRGATKSCGCLKKETAGMHVKTHGMSGSDEYRIWADIKKRCTNPNHKEFHLWGGRGIKMCTKWQNSFAEFFKSMGPRPSKKHSIDRIENNGNYEPSNCRWATPIEQAANTRKCIIVEYEGQAMTVRQFAKRLNHSYYSVYAWLVRRKMPIDAVVHKVASFQSMNGIEPKCRATRM